MSGIGRRPLLFGLILAVIYVVTLGLGMFANLAITVYGQQESILFAIAHRAAESFPTISEELSSDTQIEVFDIHGDHMGDLTPEVGLPNIDSVSFEKYLPAVLDGHEIYRFALKQNQFDLLAIVGVPMERDGMVVGALFVVRNLKNLPESLMGYAVYFTVFYGVAAVLIVVNSRRKQKLDELRQTYLDNTTHALKTPVASIKALAETLCDAVEPNPDRQRLYCSMILREANRQDHMIREAMELSKLQNQGMDLSKQRMTGDALFRPVVEKYADLFDYSEITLHVSQELLDADGLYTNARCVQQLTGVLLDNTLKFVPEGGDVWLEIEVSGKRAVICVRDNGVGIDADILPHVFDRFFKGSHDFNASGSGLGLAIAKEIAQALGEKIWVKSVNGEGTAFYFTIRLK